MKGNICVLYIYTFDTCAESVTTHPPRILTTSSFVVGKVHSVGVSFLFN